MALQLSILWLFIIYIVLQKFPVNNSINNIFYLNHS